MTELIAVPKANEWTSLKELVLDSVSSPITRRVYNLGLDEFFEWYGREPRVVHDTGIAVQELSHYERV
jgi:predicted phosphoadenosine phosphosulfate sulfurtransferase